MPKKKTTSLKNDLNNNKESSLTITEDDSLVVPSKPVKEKTNKTTRKPPVRKSAKTAPSKNKAKARPAEQKKPETVIKKDVKETLSESRDETKKKRTAKQQYIPEKIKTIRIVSPLVEKTETIKFNRSELNLDDHYQKDKAEEETKTYHLEKEKVTNTSLTEESEIIVEPDHQPSEDVPEDKKLKAADVLSEVKTKISEGLAAIKTRADEIRQKQKDRKQQKAEEAIAQPVAEITDEETIVYNRKKQRRKIVNAIMGFIVFCILLGALSGLSIVNIILNKTDVILDQKDLKNQDSTLIYDSEMNQIAIVGHESRISYSYASIPHVVIDAFVAVEDSRYFEHPGFDLPRFAKAFLENLKTLSFSQGGSTLTMQVIKNTYFAVDTIAEKSIDRKVQEIYFSLKINQIISKEKILELYINKVNFGSTARGIQIASQYYFGKDCTELSIVEAALLAGIINAPNKTNPYYHLETCKNRTNQVLYQMFNHGYITEDEYELAKKVRIENLLAGIQEVKYGTGITVDNQAYVDIVLDELETVYGINPYETPIRVYTCLNQTVQQYCDEVSRGNVIEFSDEYVNTALAVIRNNTGELIAVCGGRDYDGKMLFNYAYNNRVNPGSTSKAIFTYPMAFEYAGLGTNHYIMDEPIHWMGTRLQIREDHDYAGDVSTQRAFTTSYNVVAVKLFRWVKETKGDSVMRHYLQSIGIDDRVVSLMNEQYAIGEQHFLLSPVQLCAAQSVILSQGKYIPPHTITRIEFINNGSQEPIDCSFESEQVLSTGAAWLTRYLEKVSVNGNSSASDWKVNGRLNYIKNSKYTVYGKTGTSLYDSNIIAKYKMPSNATKDWLMVGGTNDYSFAFWMGYDTGQHLDSNSYIKQSVKAARTDGKLVSGLLEAVEQAYGRPVDDDRMPSDVTTMRHILGLYPYMSPPASSSFGGTSYIKKEFAKPLPYTSSYVTIQDLNEFSADYSNRKLNVNWGKYNGTIADGQTSSEYGHSYKVRFEKRTYTLYKKFSWSLLQGDVEYVVNVTNNTTGETRTYVSKTENASYPLVNNSSSPVTYTLTGFYRYSESQIESNSKTVTVTVNPGAPVPDIPVDPQPIGE